MASPTTTQKEVLPDLCKQNGNRQSETRNAGMQSYVYSPANWLYQRGSDTRIRTANGNTASISGLATFTYDGFNRLISSQTAAETTTYRYNALGERYMKLNQHGLSTVFQHGRGGELLYERDTDGNIKEYVWLDGRPLARIDNGTAIYYYHVDHLGTPQAMTDAAGAVKWRADYEPFGKATVKVATLENNLRFPGQYYDRETGLHYNYFRDYEPGTGRYVEADPIGLEGGMNLYAYVRGNPLAKADEFGLHPMPNEWGVKDYFKVIKKAACIIINKANSLNDWGQEARINNELDNWLRDQQIISEKFALEHELCDIRYANDECKRLECKEEAKRKRDETSMQEDDRHNAAMKNLQKKSASQIGGGILNEACEIF